MSAGSRGAGAGGRCRSRRGRRFRAPGSAGSSSRNIRTGPSTRRTPRLQVRRFGHGHPRTTSGGAARPAPRGGPRPARSRRRGRTGPARFVDSRTRWKSVSAIVSIMSCMPRSFFASVSRLSVRSARGWSAGRGPRQRRRARQVVVHHVEVAGLVVGLATSPPSSPRAARAGRASSRRDLPGGELAPQDHREQPLRAPVAARRRRARSPPCFAISSAQHLLAVPGPSAGPCGRCPRACRGGGLGRAAGLVEHVEREGHVGPGAPGLFAGLAGRAEQAERGPVGRCCGSRLTSVATWANRSRRSSVGAVDRRSVFVGPGVRELDDEPVERDADQRARRSGRQHRSSRNASRIPSASRSVLSA